MLFSIRNLKILKFEVFFRSKIRLSDDSAQTKACYKSKKLLAVINGPLIPKVYDTYWPTADFQTLRQSFFQTK